MVSSRSADSFSSCFRSPAAPSGLPGAIGRLWSPAQSPRPGKSQSPQRLFHLFFLLPGADGEKTGLFPGFSQDFQIKHQICRLRQTFHQRIRRISRRQRTDKGGGGFGACKTKRYVQLPPGFQLIQRTADPYHFRSAFLPPFLHMQQPLAILQNLHAASGISLEFFQGHLPSAGECGQQSAFMRRCFVQCGQRLAGRRRAALKACGFFLLHQPHQTLLPAPRRFQFPAYRHAAAIPAAACAAPAGHKSAPTSSSVWPNNITTLLRH